MPDFGKSLPHFPDPDSSPLPASTQLLHPSVPPPATVHRTLETPLSDAPASAAPPVRYLPACTATAPPDTLDLTVRTLLPPSPPPAHRRSSRSPAPRRLLHAHPPSPPTVSNNAPADWLAGSA